MNSIQDIKNLFRNHTSNHIETYKQVAVFIALIDIDGIPNIIFEKRSSIVKQSGDISFIGGHIDHEESPETAVIRETMEECNIDQKNIEIFSKGNCLIHTTGAFVHSFIGRIKDIDFKDIHPNEEVEYLIAIPLEKLLDTQPHKYISKVDIQRPKDFPLHLIEGGENYKFVTKDEVTYFYEINNHVIWGLTARVLKDFIDTIKNH